MDEEVNQDKIGEADGMNLEVVQRCSKWCLFKFSPSRMRITAFSIDQLL